MTDKFIPKYTRLDQLLDPYGNYFIFENIKYTEPQSNLFNDLKEFMLLNADLQDNNFATAATLATLGVLQARTILTPTYANLNLYSTIVGLTGAGKESFLTAPWFLLSKIFCENLQGLTGFTSGALIEKHISENPVTLHQIDELSDLIAKTGGKRASNFEKDILKILKSLWSAKYNASYATVGNLQNQKIYITAPANNIISCTTPEPFFAALTETMFNDGFINRFLFFPQQIEKSPLYQIKNQNIINDKLNQLTPLLRTIYSYSDRYGGKLNKESPNPKAVLWTKEAENKWQEINQTIYDLSKHNNDIANIIQRTAEMTLKIATIVAVSRDVMDINPTEPNVNINDINYAYAICQQSANFLYQSKMRKVYANKEEKYIKTIQEYIKFQGSEGISYNELAKLTPFIKDKERKEIIIALINSNAIEHDSVNDIYYWMLYR